MNHTCLCLPSSTNKTPTDLGEYGPDVVVLAHDRPDIDGPEFGEAVEEDGDVGQLGRVELWKAEQVGRLDVAQSFPGVVDVLLQLMHERRELVDGKVTAADILVHRQRQPVHALGRRVHQFVQVRQVASQDVHLKHQAHMCSLFNSFPPVLFLFNVYYYHYHHHYDDNASLR